MRAGGLSGADNEAGGLYRANVAAYFATHLLRGLPIEELDLNGAGVPISLELEADDAVDDIVLRLAGGGRAWVQTKRTLTLSTTPRSRFVESVEQWSNLAATVTLDPRRDRVSVATSRLSTPLADLNAALARGRWAVAGSRSEREERSYAKLASLLSHLDGEAKQRLLQSAVLLGLDVESDQATDAKQAQQMLENGVVPPGYGALAWRAIGDACRRRSAVRRGFDLEDLLAILRAANVPLTTDRTGVASARRAARDKAADAYRAQVARRGEELDLAGLGAQLPPVPLAGADADTRVRKTSSTKPSERQLTWSIRRHGRLLLTGAPGAGKSTTLRASAADFARRADWPLPVFAKLTDVAQHLPVASFQDALFAASTLPLDLDPESIDLVREAFETAVRDGRAALFLDALDETRTERHQVVRRIRQFLQTAHPDLELVLATREVAYADAAILRLREIEVAAPRHPEQTARRILEVAAAHRGVEEPNRQQWVSERLRWVETVLSRDRTLSRTPLIPVVLAVLASKSDNRSLPTKRAEILKRVLEDIVTAWEAGERLRGSVSLGALAGPRAVTALLVSLPVAGALLSQHGQVPRTDVARVLADVFRDQFALASADASTSANEALAFWDEAGVFVSSADGLISPRLRLFAEIAGASQLATLRGEELRAAAAVAARDPNQHETLQLAAGLSEEVADALWEVARREDSSNQVSMTLANALIEGAEVSDETLVSLVRRLASTLTKTGSWAAAVALARLPVPPRLRGEVRQCAARALDGGALIAFGALSVSRWQETGPEAEEALREVLRAERVRLGQWKVDDAYEEALVGAADRLRSGGAADVALIQGALGKATMRADERLAEFLRAAGRSDAVTEYYGRFTSQLRDAWQFDVEHAVDKTLLELIATVGEPRRLTHRQERRMDELCDFIATLGIPDATGADVVRAVKRGREEVLSLLQHVAPLTGLDRDVVASEARLVREMLETDDGPSLFTMLFDEGTDHGFKDWGSVSNHPHLRRVLRAHIAGLRWLAVPAAVALSATPERDAATKELEGVLHDYEPWNRTLAAKVLMSLDPAHLERARIWATSHDPVYRIVAGEELARHLPAHATLRPLVDKVLTDSDEGVREGAYSSLDPSTLDATLRRMAWAEAEGQPTGWFCIWCGHVNSADADGCAKCAASGPDAAKAARELLAAAGENVPDVNDHVRRHVKIVNLDESARTA